MKTGMLIRLGAVAAIIVPAVAFAQTLYKQVRPDGSIIYSDRPVPGAKVLETTDTPPPPPPPPAQKAGARTAGGPGKAPEVRQAGEGKPAASKAAKSENALDKADAEVRAAQEALEAAKHAREAGEEPLPGERLGTATGGSRLSDAYEERQRQLEKAVTDAEARLQRAYDARNAAR